jgi:hypothetical protein
MPAQRLLHIHVGVPKTGTTYLQQVLAKNRGALRKQGVLYPGPYTAHFLAAQDLLQRPFRGYVDPRVSGSWAQVVKKVNNWDGPALLSHEMLARLREEHIERILADFPDHEIHVVVTARDLLRQLPAVWQEDLKNGNAQTLVRFMRKARQQATATEQPQGGFWSHQAIGDILERWEKYLPADRLVVVTVPPSGADRNLLWDRFAEVVGVTLPREALVVKRANESVGAAEAELLRRLNQQVADDWDWPRYRTQVKQFLVSTALADKASRPIRLNADDTAWGVQVSRDLVDRISGRGYRVVGSWDELVPTESAAAQVDPDAGNVPEEEVAQAGVNATVRLLDARNERPLEPLVERAAEPGKKLLGKLRRGKGEGPHP